MKLFKSTVRPFVRNTGLIALGTIVFAFGTAVFAIPFNLVSGGMSGLAIVFSHIVPNVSVDLYITVLNWGLFLVGLILLGKGFALHTLISAILYPPCITLFSTLISPNVLGGVFYLQGSEYSTIAILVATLFGGLVSGVGCSLTFMGGGSTGGTDVIAFSLCKFFPRLRSSVILFLLDTVIISMGLFVIGDLVVTLLGILYSVIYALVVDKIFLGGQAALIAQIISDNCDEINQNVIERLERTTTLFHVTGGYSKENKKLLMVSFTMRQYAELRHIIHQCDKKAFVTVYRAHEINGEGWTR